MLLSDSQIKDELGAEVAIEYTRDSPFFRQQLMAFESSFHGVRSYAANVSVALKGVDSALSALQSAQSELAAALAGSNGNSRCLFTNAHPKLGNLSSILKMMSETFLNINKVQSAFQDSLKLDVGSVLDQLIGLDNEKERAHHRKEMERLSEEYETNLCASLGSRDKLSPGKERELIEIRREYELARFDIVANLNKMNGKKKRLLCRAVSSIYNCYLGFFYSASNFLAKKSQSSSGRGEDYVKLEEALDGAEKTAELHEELWDCVRSKLEGEVIGAAAPPGAPPGSLSPIQPRYHTGMSPFTTTLSVEVLSNETRSAAYEDVRHSRDDGVFKQGFLFVSSGYFSKRRRRWHRLFSTKLYAVDNPKSADDPSCESTVIIDVTGATVACKPGHVPHVIILVPSNGKRLELQAENEDEMVQWIQAIKRCAAGAPGRPKQINRATIQSTQEMEPELDTFYSSAKSKEFVSGTASVSVTSPAKAKQEEVFYDVITRPGPAAAQVLDFVSTNPTCAECSFVPVSWVSTSLGISLCEECATVHRQLGWAVSKLKNIALDEFYEWQMQLLVDLLGNKVLNSIWEISIPNGWKKPSPSSAVEDKASYIIGKYKWYGFVDDYSTNAEDLAIGIHEASLKGNVPEVMWWMSHKADTNSTTASSGGRTPLHVAVENSHINLVAFLLLNGADIYAKDNTGTSPLDLVQRLTVAQPAQSTTFRLITNMILSIQRGDY